jgi:hypothetical protein
MIGSGKYRYRPVEGWGLGPQGRAFGGVLPGLDVDSADRVYISRRTPPALLVYDREGRYLATFGEGILKNPHGVHVSADDYIWVTDVNDHTVRKFNRDGQIVMTLGTAGEPGAPGQPFNRPTKAVQGPSGEILVSDGYGQYRVHKFSAGGQLLKSWGSEGTGPGQFKLPHSISVDPFGRILVPDRENSRIEIFDLDGAYLGEWSHARWPGIQWPNEAYVHGDGLIYVTEAGYRVSVWQYAASPVRSPIASPADAWELLARWGDMGDGPGQFAECPHAIGVDSHGDIYVAEVPFVAAGRLQKFERV